MIFLYTLASAQYTENSRETHWQSIGPASRISRTLQELDLSWKEVLEFRLEKVVEIKVWQVGLFLYEPTNC